MKVVSVLESPKNQEMELAQQVRDMLSESSLPRAGDEAVQITTHRPSMTRCLLTIGAHAQRELGLCVRLFVSVKSHLIYGASVRPENAVTYSAGNEGQNICGDLPETTAFKSYAAKHERKSQYANFSDLPAVSFLRLTYSKAPESCQQHPALPKTMLTDASSLCWSEN